MKMLQRNYIYKSLSSWAWCHMPFIPALERQRQKDIYQFEANLVYIMYSTIAKTVQTLSQRNKTQQNK